MKTNMQTVIRDEGVDNNNVLLFCPLTSQGTNASALEKDIGPEQFPINEHYFGLVNVSITKSSRTLTKVIANKHWCPVSKQSGHGTC